VIEKEKAVVLHASGRNPGALHAGFYYFPASLKAKSSREGIRKLKELALKHNFEVRNIGKIVVTPNEAEHIDLVKLYERGLSGGGNQLRQPYLRDKEKYPLPESPPNVVHVHNYGWYLGNYSELGSDSLMTQNNAWHK
jgi:L-2-hydroxyglutarate oxidase LhgO